MKYCMFLLAVCFTLNCCSKKHVVKEIEVERFIYDSNSGTQTFKEQKQLPCKVSVVNSPINCTINIQKFESNNKLVTYQFELKKGENITMPMTVGVYDLFVKYKDRNYQFQIGSSYLKSWNINLKNFLLDAKKIHETRKETHFVLRI